jgi:regulator of telomere elongation helicase 1
MPYNYITDISLLQSFSEIVKNSIIIFDEAHNVPEAACNGRSFELEDKTFDNVEIELTSYTHSNSS